MGVGKEEGIREEGVFGESEEESCVWDVGFFCGWYGCECVGICSGEVVVEIEGGW